MDIGLSARPRETETGATFIYWWAHPALLALFVHLPIFYLCAQMDESAYALYGHSSMFLTGEAFELGLLAIAAFALCSLLFEPRGASVGLSRQVRAPAVNAALDVLIIAVLGAYAIFLFPIIVKPQLLLDLLHGSTTAMFDLRETLNRIPGVTSLVALQSLVAVLVVGYVPLTGERMPSKYWRLLVLVVIACMLRAWLWSERLALIELVLPIAIVTSARANPSQLTKKFRFLAFAPLLGLTVIFGLFCLGEYFRSWQFYQYVYPGSFLEFSLVRFAGYYATALNNGAAFFTLHDPLYAPVMTAPWFYKFPLWQFFDTPGLNDHFDHLVFIEAYLNPEFNNTSGVFMPLFDFGPVLGVACWMGLGAISGVLFRSFARGDIPGIVFYPVWFTGIAELLRVFYWGDARFFPVIIGGLILSRYLKKNELRSNVPNPVALSVVAGPG